MQHVRTYIHTYVHMICMCTSVIHPLRQWQSDTTQVNHYWKPPVESCVAVVCVVELRTIFSPSALSLACIALCSISFISFVRPSLAAAAAAGTAGVGGRGQWVGSIGVVCTHIHTYICRHHVCTQCHCDQCCSPEGACTMRGAEGD